MSYISDETLEKCNTLKELLDIKTNNGQIKYPHIVDENRSYKGFYSRLDFFKAYLAENLPELTIEEILKFDSVFQKFKKTVYEMYGYHDFLAAIEFENKKNKI